MRAPFWCLFSYPQICVSKSMLTHEVRAEGVRTSATGRALSALSHSSVRKFMYVTVCHISCMHHVGALGGYPRSAWGGHSVFCKRTSEKKPRRNVWDA